MPILGVLIYWQYVRAKRVVLQDPMRAVRNIASHLRKLEPSLRQGLCQSTLAQTLQLIRILEHRLIDVGHKSVERWRSEFYELTIGISQRKGWVRDVTFLHAIGALAETYQSITCAVEAELSWAQTKLPHSNDNRAVRQHLRTGQADPYKPAEMPCMNFAPLTAPGPSGERPEHMKCCMEAPHASMKRRINKALEKHSVQASLHTLSHHTRLVLDTSWVWLSKEELSDQAEEDDWLCLSESLRPEERFDCLTDASVEEAVEVKRTGKDDLAEHSRQDEKPESAIYQNCNETMGENPAVTCSEAKPKVRPMLMGEYLRQFFGEDIREDRQAAHSSRYAGNAAVRGWRARRS